MNTSTTPAGATTLNKKDVYYILFRHKWRIALCSLAGFAAAVAIFRYFPPPFQSDARLFIRYVITQDKAIELGPEDAVTKSPDQRGETIMSAEVEILTSYDLARQVAEKIGPERILARHGGGADLGRATAIVRNGLVVQVPMRSSVIHLSFKDRDPELVQPVLREVIARYLQTHVEIHRAIGIVSDFLSQETDQLRASLAQTEDELRKARNKAGVISLDGAKKEYADQMARTRDDLYHAKADLAQQVALVEQLSRRSGAATTDKTPDGTTNAPAELSPELRERYQAILVRQDMLRRREQELLSQFTAENPRVKDVEQSLAQVDAARKQFEQEHPAALAHSVTRVITSAPASASALDLTTEAAKVAALQAKVDVLNAELEQIRKDASSLDQMELSIVELRRRQQLEEANYKYFAQTLEQSRINEAFGAGRVSNISQVETPTPPFKDWSKWMKILAGIALGGIGAGIGWAALIEFVLDHTVRRPGDVEKGLKVPLFLTIPDFRRRRYRRLHHVRGKLPPSSAHERKLLLANGAASPAESNPDSVPHPLHAFHETLRDRLIGYFESRNVTRKPKLVAVTGIGGGGAGVTTTAAGLASCLSETGDSNVLLVDLTPGQGSAKAFQNGKEFCNLDQLLETRSHGQVQDNLYVVAETGNPESLSRLLPQRFAKIVPRLKTSDFDYIIFDMPPVSQISITPRLAGYMDMVLLVLESETTDLDIAQRATKLLTDAKAHVGVVLNKTRTYLPSRLHREYIGQA